MTTTLSRTTSNAAVLSRMAAEAQAVRGWWTRYNNGPDALAVVELRELLHQSEPMAFALIQTHGAFGTELQRVRATLRDAMPLHPGGGWAEGEPNDGEDALDAECAPVPTPAEWMAIQAAADAYARTLDSIGGTLPAGEDHTEPVDGPTPEHGVAGYALTPEHEAVLRALCKRPDKCGTAIDIAGWCKDDGRAINRETVGGLLLPYLAEKGLVKQPHEKKKGWSATTLGTEWYGRQPASTRTA